ncbi:hypothetical protein BC835DRAFT_1368235 [Cytidiella melzeri]|nr:hypothetical protein BC835DRAFT_1368235 [Cytidiella melzeri]
MQNNIAPREASPSPSFRERQRTIKAHSMPIVPSVGQVLAGNTAQQNISQPSPTGSNGSLPARRSPPATSRISPVTTKLASMSVNVRGDRTPERMGSPPPMIHSQSTPAVPQLSASQGGAHQPRPMPRVIPPQFLTQFQMDEKWHVTEELLAEIDRADQQQGQLQGTSGVAYAGGAASNSSLHLNHVAKDPAVERVRASDRSSPKEFDNNGQKRQVREKEREPQTNVRESPKTRERSQTTSSLPASQHVDMQTHAQRTPEYRGSPPFHTPMASPGERTASYTQYVPDSYQTPQGTAQPATRKPAPASTESTSPRGTPPAAVKLPAQTQSTNPRASDRALPLQEEPEEDLGHEFTEHESDFDKLRRSSPTPSSDLYPEGRYGSRRDLASSVQPTDEDDEDTLNEEAHDHLQVPNKSDDEDSGFTPRSPSTSLPERPRDERYSPTNGQYSTQFNQISVESQKTLRAKHARVGSTDQLGMRSFDPALFESTISSLRSTSQDSNGSIPRIAKPLQASPLQAAPLVAQPQQQQQQQQPYMQIQQQQQTRQYIKPVDTQYAAMNTVPLSPHYEDLQGVFDNPTSSYLQTFLQSPTPDGRNAPVPPTPMTQTAAPSPSPMSVVPSDIEPRQIGSPYPYPFAHIRRTAVSATHNAATSTFDPNDIAHVREQLQMQMQIYALNNGLAPPSESTFSPSSTPFPGVGYNPWAFMHQQQGAPRYADAAMSMRSSPSHEPIQLPVPQYRGGNHRPLRRKGNNDVGGLRAPLRRKVKPPPRVESTQPRDTSPEPSSGEETAGETSFGGDHHQQYGVPSQAANGSWQNGSEEGHHDAIGEQVEEEEDEGDWVDDDDEEAEDMLQLEYHHSYVVNPVKRKRRWESRWEALAEGFRALDRETDTTLLVLAAPAHSKKLHALTSRNIRRDPNLLQSTTLAKIRSSFSSLADQRRANRVPKMSLAEQFSGQSAAASVDGSQSGEEGLRRALDAALGSLGALGTLYDQREARWREEMRRLSEDRERVGFLLAQVLGPSVDANGKPHEEAQLLG